MVEHTPGRRRARPRAEERGGDTVYREGGSWSRRARAGRPPPFPPRAPQPLLVGGVGGGAPAGGAAG